MFKLTLELGVEGLLTLPEMFNSDGVASRTALTSAHPVRTVKDILVDLRKKGYIDIGFEEIKRVFENLRNRKGDIH